MMIPWRLVVWSISIVGVAAAGCSPKATVHVHDDPGSHDHLELHARAADGHEHCICDRVKLINGWCAACQAGCVAGVRIESADLFDAIDAHGHDFIADSIECQSCQRALASEGFCEPCLIGFVDGQLYCSKVSYCLARGTPVEQEMLTCQACRKAYGSARWCSDCGSGIVGNVRFTDHEHHQAAREQHQALVSAARELSRCETCAVLMITGGSCPKCAAPATGTSPRH